MNQTLQSIYLDATNSIRHFDSQRDNSGKFFIAILSGLLTSSQFVEQRSYVFFSAIICLSIIFFLFQRKLAYLIELQRARARISLKEISRENFQIAEINKTARSEILKVHPHISKLPVSRLWDLFYLFFLSFSILLIL